MQACACRFGNCPWHSTGQSQQQHASLLCQRRPCTPPHHLHPIIWRHPTSKSRVTQTPEPQVEVKIRLPNREAYDKVAQALAGALQATHEQENYFFDGSDKRLNAQRAVLRLRFYDVDKKAVITVKVWGGRG
jgi:hypothetical protein